MPIAAAVARASAYLTDHPDEARYRYSAATATIGSGLRVDVRGPGGESLATDMPAGIGGVASASRLAGCCGPRPRPASPR